MGRVDRKDTAASQKTEISVCAAYRRVIEGTRDPIRGKGEFKGWQITCDCTAIRARLPRTYHIKELFYTRIVAYKA